MILSSSFTLSAFLSDSSILLSLEMVDTSGARVLLECPKGFRVPRVLKMIERDVAERERAVILTTTTATTMSTTVTISM